MVHEKEGHKKKRHEEKHAAAEPDQSEVRWLISYSDFMMQLVCLFILLYSVSSVDVAKLKEMVAAWREQQGMKPIRVENAPPEGEVTPLTLEQIPEAVRQMQIEVGLFTFGRFLRITPDTRGFRIQFTYPMFEEGSTRVTPDGAKLLDLAAMVLKPYEPRVAVIELVGHSSPEEDEGGLRLSLARSHAAHRAVTRSDAAYRLDPRRLAASGRGPYDLGEDARLESGHARHRRVDFLIRLAPGPNP